MGNKTKSFSYTATFPSGLYNTTLEATKSDGTTTSIAVSSTGKASFSLKNDESITFTTLTSTQIENSKISEADYTSEGYETTSTSSTTTDGDVKLSFTNTRTAAVPTGAHNDNAMLWMLAIGGLGIVSVVLMRKLRNRIAKRANERYN